MAKHLQMVFEIAAKLSGTFFGALSTATGALKGLKNAANGVQFGNLSVGRLQRALTELNRVKELAEKYRTLRDNPMSGGGFNKYLSELERVKASLKAAGFSTKDFENSLRHLTGSIDQVSKALSAQKRIADARREQDIAGNNFNNAWTNMSNALDTAQTIMSPLAESTRTAMSFEAALSKTKALTQMDHIRSGATSAIESEMAMLRERYLEIGRTTQFSATEAANAGNYLAMAGWNAQKIDAGLPSVVNLAIASGSGVERAADILSNIQTGFGIGTSAEEIQHLADVLTYTVTHSNQDLSQLGDTMKYVAPVAKMFGSSVEETAALTKFMADAGIQGSMAGTSLRATMLRLVAPPKKASKAMLENGITVDDASKAWVNAQETAAEYGITLEQSAKPGEQMASIIDQINTKMSGLSTHEKMAAFSAITGINAVSGAMNIFEQDADTIRNFTKELRNSSEGTGAAAQTAGVMADNAQGAMVSLESAIEAAKISVGEAFLPTVRSALEGLTSITRSIATFASEHQGLVQGFGAIAAAAAAGLVALSGFRLALAGINFAATTLELMRASAAFELLMGRFGAATGVLGRLSAITGAFRAGGLAAGIGAIGSALAGAARAAAAFIFSPWGLAIAAITAVAAAIYANWDRVGPYFEKLWTTIVSGAEKAAAALRTIFGAFEPVLDALMKPFEERAARENRALLQSGMREELSGAFELKGDRLDELTRSTRSILRSVEGKSDEEVTEALWERLSSERQTDSVQGEMLSMLRSELSRREELSEERRGSIERLINERMFGAKESGTDAATSAILSSLSKRELKSEEDLSAALSYAKGALTERRELSEAEKAAALGAVKERLDGERAALTFTKAVQEELKGAKLETLSGQTELVERALKLASDSAASNASKLERFEGALSGAKGLNEAARSEMAAAFREGLSKQGEVKRERASAEEVWASTPREAVRKEPATKALPNVLPWQNISPTLGSSKPVEAPSTGLLEKVIGSIGSVFKAPAPKSAPLPWQNLPSTLGASKPVEPPSTGLIGELIGSIGRFFETKSESAPTRAVSSSIAPVPTQADVITLPPIKVPEIDLRAAFESAASSATEVFSTIGTSLTETFSSAATSVSEVFSTIGMSLTEAFSSASMMASEAFVSIQTSMSELQMSATMFGAEISMALTEAFSGLSETVGAALTGVLSTVMSVGNEIIGFVSGTLAGAWDAAWNAMLASFSGVFSSLGGIAQGVLGGILSTVQSIASAISSISLPNFGGGGVSIGHHAEGGIYAKGAHLTWFAETSAEAAIPIVRDRNSIGLWTRVGQMLGLLPKSGGKPLSPSKPKSGAELLSPFKGAGSIPILSIPRVRGGRRPLPPEQVEAAAAAARSGNPLSLSIPRISPAPSPFKAEEDLVSGVRESKSYESLQSRVNEFERLRSEKESVRESSYDHSSIPPITLHFTFNGSADREGVKAGVMESLPMIRESFEEQMNRYRHEKARRSF